MPPDNVPNIILQQLGGKRFIAMTGSRNFTSGHVDGSPWKALTMHLARNKMGATHLTIALEPMDWYSMTFYRVRYSERNGVVTTTLKRVDGVYCDMLEDVFTEETGLYTRL